MKFIPETHRAY